jgi:transcriptional regulator with XRE-family HTH domain
MIIDKQLIVNSFIAKIVYFMDLKRIFIQNMKKFREREGISQMNLAEQCDTDASYIGQIEIGIRFPSMSLIGKIADALEVEPYRLFMENQGPEFSLPKKDTDFLAQLPDGIKRKLIKRLNTAVSACIRDILSSRNL